MRISFIGKFNKMHDEEYIAEGFESIGHFVQRIPDVLSPFDIGQAIKSLNPDILLYCKWQQPKELDETIESLKKGGMKTVCWLFDLYLGYAREEQVKTKLFFKSDYVFTTDGGHDEEFKRLGVNHHCIRQGIRNKECFIQEGIPKGIAFIGSDNPLYPYRCKMLGKVIARFNNGFTWYGRGDTDEMRGTKLNELFGNTKVIIGDSVYSPYYWSNRVVETLGRGGFLIHSEVEGLKEEYPYLVTYQKDNVQDLLNKIKYYSEHENERKEILQRNFEWVRHHYTIDKKCRELIDYVFTSHNKKV